ncbi:MAG: hypothetical protein RIS70_1005 [Planctomycetota bacterium]|jgi:hypothetical protein
MWLLFVSCSKLRSYLKSDFPFDRAGSFQSAVKVPPSESSQPAKSLGQPRLVIAFAIRSRIRLGTLFGT